MNYLDSLVHRLRDRRIIQAFAKLLPSFVETITPQRYERLIDIELTALDGAVIFQEPKLDIPLLPTDKFQRPGAENYEDPYSTGRKVELLTAMSIWEPYQEQMIKDALRGTWSFLDSQSSGRILRSAIPIQKALESFYERNGTLPTEQFLQRLWQHRWIYNADFCAFWLQLVAIVRHGATSAEEANSALTDSGEPLRAFTLVEQLLADAKETSEDLNDWFEKLYLAMPFAHYAGLLYRMDQSGDGKARARWLAEARADINTIWSMGIEIFLPRLQPLIGPAPHFWSLPDLGAKPSAANIKHELRRLSFNYRTRITYPRFWFDAARNSLQSGVLPSEMIGEYEPRRVISMAITYSPMRASWLLAGKST